MEPRLIPGSPAWWAARPRTPAAAAEAPRRGRPPVDFGRIVATALRLVDEVGVQAFTLRMLADALGSGTATLYRHFAGKDELLVHVVDHVLGDVGTPAPGATATWRESLTAVADALYLTLRRHPHVLPLLIAQVPIGPNGLAQRERVLQLLLAHGFPADLAARAFTAVSHYVIGFVAQQHGPGSADPDSAPALAAFYRGLDTATYPAITTAARTLTRTPLDEEFRFGLALLVTGLEHLVDGHPPQAL
ncbi:TetR/AcrR family transcriptional regulator [Streptomyces sp. NPDC057617]|uniref:TetR/AcrR family transcriptional regulator n=1 Tax=Streptomyces sp. NPDC057617 TaxID=3346184 RepID=UPI00368CEAC6